MYSTVQYVKYSKVLYTITVLYKILYEYKNILDPYIQVLQILLVRTTYIILLCGLHTRTIFITTVMLYFTQSLCPYSYIRVIKRSNYCRFN